MRSLMYVTIPMTARIMIAPAALPAMMPALERPLVLALGSIGFEKVGTESNVLDDVESLVKELSELELKVSCATVVTVIVMGASVLVLRSTVSVVEGGGVVVALSIGRTLSLLTVRVGLFSDAEEVVLVLVVVVDVVDVANRENQHPSKGVMYLCSRTRRRGRG